MPQNYDNSREILGWLSRRWLYNIPRSLETRGYRPLGRVALVDNSQRVMALLDQKLQQLAQLASSPDRDGQPRDPKINVILLAGTGGGTGAGMVLDVANAVKSLAATRNLQVEVNGALILTCLVENNSSQLAAANTYALLTELNHATATGNQASAERTAQDGPFESPKSPFDCVYCIPLPSGRTQGKDGLDAVAKYLALETTPGARAALRACRISRTPREQSHNGRLSLKKIGYSSLGDQMWDVRGRLAADLAEEVKQYWLMTDRSADWQRLVREEQNASSSKSDAKKASPNAETNTQENVTPLTLRSRFHEFMSLEFVSEVVRQIQTRLEARDLRGRSLISARDAKLIADAARAAIASLAENGVQQSCTLRFSQSTLLRPLIPEVSRRVLRRAIEECDGKQLESFVLTDEPLQAECQALLEETLLQPETSAALTAILDLDEAVDYTLDRAAADLLQCGSDRRTLVFVPKPKAHASAVEKLRILRPLAAVVDADVEDVLVVCEDSGVSPRSLAIGLERVFPGIADAARRLLTRIDIEWTGLL